MKRKRKKRRKKPVHIQGNGLSYDSDGRVRGEGRTEFEALPPDTTARAKRIARHIALCPGCRLCNPVRG